MKHDRALCLEIIHVQSIVGVDTVFFPIRYGVCPICHSIAAMQYGETMRSCYGLDPEVEGTFEQKFGMEFHPSHWQRKTRLPLDMMCEEVRAEELKRIGGA